MYPELQLLLDNFEAVAADAARVSTLGADAWKEWPEEHYSDGGNQDWKIFPFAQQTDLQRSMTVLESDHVTYRQGASCPTPPLLVSISPADCEAEFLEQNFANCEVAFLE